MGVSVPVNVKKELGAAGSAPVFGVRAWVNFNGAGVVAIRSSGNVSSITDNGVGDYTINYSTALPDANYCMSGICGMSDNIDPSIRDDGYMMIPYKVPDASSANIRTGWINAGNQIAADLTYVFVMVVK